MPDPTSSTPPPDDDFAGFTPEERQAARRVRSARPAGLPGAKVDRIERRVLQRFESQKRTAARPAWPVVRQWAAALALAGVLVMTGAGLAAASTSSLPGEALYPIKRLSEDVQLGLAPESERPALYTRLAAGRLAEIEALAAQGIVDPAVIQDMADSTEQALAGADASQTGQQAALFEELIALSDRQQAVLERVRAGAPQSAQAALAHAQAVSTNGRERAEAALKKLGGTPPGQALTTPGGAQTSTPLATSEPAAAVTPTPAAQGQTPPGQEHTPPGQAKTPPGQAKTPPGQEHTPPGQEKTPPGQAKTPNPGSGQGGGNGHGQP